ncbi:MAG: class I SAM-dependent methyltransferase [Xanthomonadales bacterium]|nr:class I SAM-dependent methyltransferase [Gammaproteobacteria bacterium]MBT8055395.1 class I SAM-dependent methyltransferase [Gammaproteobacteria bacterium]NNL04704.1 class I SAM-dependent methyltransferase [Xanthomonadales bacterium]
MSSALEFTGERFTPECVREIRYEHVHRYAFARELVAGRRVLDAACGEGYGAALLADRAAAVTGVDLSAAAVAHAGERYRAPNLEFRQADCLDLPFEDASFDAVVSFETLEHLQDHDRLLEEFSRVLQPDGFLLISTPDKAVYTEALGNENEFHVAELYHAEFENLLNRFFSCHLLWGQKLVFQSEIWALEGDGDVHHSRESESGITTQDKPEHRPVYLLALCAASQSALPRPNIALSLFDDQSESVYSHYHHEIRKNMAAGELLHNKDREIADLRRALEQVRRPWWRRWLDRR